MNDFKVNLFIVGAAKCGTTYLAEYLDQHSAVNMASIKEPDYFSHDLLRSRVDYYETNPVKDIEAYKGLFNHDKTYTYHGEASVSYLPYAKAAQGIYDYNSDARIIILMRPPTDRAFSHYKMDKRLGLIKESFASVVNGQNQSKWQDQYYHQYVELGFYHQQVSTYIKLFGPEQVYCMQDSSNLDEKLLDILDFLSLPSEPIQQKRANEAVSFKNPLLRHLYASSGIRRVLKKLIPRAVIHNIKRQEEVMDKEVRIFLEDLYCTDQEHLKRLLKNE